MTIFFAIFTYYSYIITKFRFYQLISVKYRFPFQILHFLAQNHLALLTDRFLKKMLLKRVNTGCFSFAKLKAENNSSTLIEQKKSFKNSEV